MKMFLLSTTILILMSSTAAAQRTNSALSDPPAVAVCDGVSDVCLPEEQVICDSRDNDCDDGIRSTRNTRSSGDRAGNRGPQADSEVCDGMDDDCSDAADEPLRGFRRGLTSSGNEVCDGIDNDCDTGDVAGGTESIGGAVHDAEICDGFDEDCDGYGDEGLRSDRPTTRRSDARGSNRSSSRTTGGGYNSSRSNNSSRSASSGGGSDSDGLCDGFDNDCDGLTDAADACNDADLSVRCSLPYGNSDYRDLDSDNDGLLDSAREICNGMDDDCDGYVSDRAARPAVYGRVAIDPGEINTSRGEDLSRPEGVGGSAWLDDDDDGDSVPTACNAQDDDCDDVIDEQPGASGNLEGDPDRPVVTGRTYSGSD